jgi:N-acetyltransferase
VRPVPLVTLEGAHVRLEPLSLEHVDALTAAAEGPRGTFTMTFVPDRRDAVRAYVEAAIAEHAEGTALPFAIVSREHARVVGSTRFGCLEAWPWPEGHASTAAEGAPDAVEIGWTWLCEEAQRSAINTEAKLLMLGHAFETWHVYRVSLITDVRNVRSRAAIERIGATFEGVRRAHFPAPDGTLRDSALYSIVAGEWPGVRARLDRMRSAPRT